MYGAPSDAPSGALGIVLHIIWAVRALPDHVIQDPHDISMTGAYSP
jgi:hypothetical protein